MAARGVSGHDAIHRQAFAHYLRTGQRLTNSEWLGRQERKFNPYHDEIGRFTSPPGVTVSYGKRAGPTGRSAKVGQTSQAPRDGTGSQANNPRSEPVRPRGATRPDSGSMPKRSPTAPNGAVDTAIREKWAPVAPIVSHFDLRQRQAHLDALRKQAGPNASAADRAAFEETQRRLDWARDRLADGDRIADREVVQIARRAIPPLDTGLSVAAIASGKGDLGDAVTVASSIPVIGMVRKVGGGRLLGKIVEAAGAKITPLAGPHWKVKNLKPAGYQSNHIPPKSVTGEKPGAGTSIGMPEAHHKNTASYGNGRAARAHRAAQKALVEKGRVDDAIQMDVDDIRKKYGGIYEETFRIMRKHNRTKGGK